MAFLVRAAYVTDDDIRAVARDYPAGSSVGLRVVGQDWEVAA